MGFNQGSCIQFGHVGFVSVGSVSIWTREATLATFLVSVRSMKFELGKGTHMTHHFKGWVTRQFVTSIKYQQIHINSGWFEVLPRHQHFILHLPDLYKNVLKMEQQK
ncbi:hypothetical protein CMV_018613 [Castanea mollissima]|uniref:Uncharacterized protein n=1 Tax=Castanea mollissima TaxID=60419 RepID=A0A8J4R0Q5_9ROSI|nr:hypothetical protein CMV_018613 [Castanea mollissima]